MFPIKHRNKFFVISGAMILCAFALMLIFGFNIGTDFKGGTIIEVKYQNNLVPEKSQIENAITSLNLGEASVRRAGEAGFIVRTKDLPIEAQEALKSTLNFEGTYPYELERLNSVGPTIGKELTEKAWIAIIAIIIITIFFIAYAFRGVSKNGDGSNHVSSWSFGLVSIVALVHDITIPAGAAVLLGKFAGVELDALFVTALLSLLGYSINDTIIIFDRIRDNLKENQEYKRHESFEDTVGKSLSQTYGRSINTSFTVFLVLVSLYLLGSESIKFFILTLLIGTVAGSYSSIFLAAPLLVTINNWRRYRS